VDIYKGDKKIGSGVPEVIYDREWGIVTHVYIERGILNDVYVIFQGFSPHQENIIIPITVKVVPYITFLWMGILLLIIGITIKMHQDAR
jgi:cytochrome c biogenesis factor